VFIASQVLAHWKEREPVYRRRRHFLAQENNGVVPAYAEDLSDADTTGPARRRERLTAPDDPNRQVSREEFDAMVRDLHVDAPPTGTAVKDPEPTRQPAPDASPDDLVMKDDKTPKPRKPRNKKHGRSR
jgi:SecD/SecF fusion protein